ncbi:hypothetical protein F1D05_02575 [Kribbella qitaiheensis]|uniref:Uncharacterized protein n=1 Tax=Kribbella qitaiheensis TaxID=1544730 RepID=A0A7G6WSN1_9ACTN|nr:hypothetical protein [Kribbella qitaiheensis]QNE16996.1 hypothetical protein F1D05_02575 [Kribbella qitaiheensis]
MKFAKKAFTTGLAAIVMSGGLATTTVPARAAGRVDLAKPTFSHPTRITNPLFPARRLDQLLQLGSEDGEKLRFETTRLKTPVAIRWGGKTIDTVVQQFVAYGDGRVAEVAVDYYAQADDGSVWYFGEKVDNYVDGVIHDHSGTWLAGRDGPPGMIMPAHPRVGDVFRPENIPGLVLEVATVTATGLTVAGPRGPVPGAIRVRNLELDGSIEQKIFAPAYGEFQASVAATGESYEAALAIPADSIHCRRPRRLIALDTTAARVLVAAGRHDWRLTDQLVRTLNQTWIAHRHEVRVPTKLSAQFSETLQALRKAVASRKAVTIRQAAVKVGLAAVDLQAQYRSVRATDHARIAWWRHQLQIDRATGDAGEIAGDKAVLTAIRNRLVG